MIWVAFGYLGKSPIFSVIHKIDSKYYCDLSDNVLVEFGDDLWGSDGIFQQGNAAIHISRKTKQFLSSKNIMILKWPAVSPYLNRIEKF